uniref:Large ribosomal subunit protein uL18 n=1 Tax=Chlamydiales bacterium PN TaxID=1910939 RepID=A0A1K0IT61_9CHLA|nr:50S ribosomal protein L18 [Chlamydiales bacterium PN]
MESSVVKAQIAKQKRAIRVRKQIRGSAQRPRLCVVKSNKHVYAQLIDDVQGVTLANMATTAKELRSTEHCKKSKPAARLVGEKIAEKAKALGIEEVIFDRGSFKYHGILAELADGARAAGLKF